VTKSNLSACDNAIKHLSDQGYSMLATVFFKGQCKHLHRNGFLYAVSDMSGTITSGITETEAWKRFNNDVPSAGGSKFKPAEHTQLEDLDATLKELEENFKVIALRALSYISDYVDRTIERLS